MLPLSWLKTMTLCVPGNSNMRVHLTSFYTDISFHFITMHFCHVFCQCLILAVSTAVRGVYLSVAEEVVISRQTAYTLHCGKGGI